MRPCGVERFARVALAAAVTGAAALAFGAARMSGSPLPGAPNCPIFPATNVWNKRVDSFPVAVRLGHDDQRDRAHAPVHPDFGSFAGVRHPGEHGARAATPKRQVRFLYASESDPGPYPIPAHPLHRGRLATVTC